MEEDIQIEILLLLTAIETIQQINLNIYSSLPKDSETDIFVSLKTDGLNFYVEFLGTRIWDSTEAIQNEDDYIMAVENISYEIEQNVNAVVNSVYLLPFNCTSMN